MRAASLLFRYLKAGSARARFCVGAIARTGHASADAMWQYALTAEVACTFNPLISFAWYMTASTLRLAVAFA
jgi:hypothetical protein